MDKPYAYCHPRFLHRVGVVRPVNAIVANIVSLLPLPALKLLDVANSGCGDGLCSVFSGLLLLLGLAIATIVFLVRSARRNETPAVLRAGPFLLWPLALLPLAF